MLASPSSPGVALLPMLGFKLAILFALTSFFSLTSFAAWLVFPYSNFTYSIVLSSADLTVGSYSALAPDVSIPSVTLSVSMADAPVAVVSFTGDTVLVRGGSYNF